MQPADRQTSTWHERQEPLEWFLRMPCCLSIGSDDVLDFQNFEGMRRLERDAAERMSKAFPAERIAFLKIMTYSRVSLCTRYLDFVRRLVILYL